MKLILSYQQYLNFQTDFNKVIKIQYSAELRMKSRAYRKSLKTNGMKLLLSLAKLKPHSEHENSV